MRTRQRAITFLCHLNDINNIEKKNQLDELNMWRQIYKHTERDDLKHMFGPWRIVAVVATATEDVRYASDRARFYLNSYYWLSMRLEFVNRAQRLDKIRGSAIDLCVCSI